MTAQEFYNTRMTDTDSEKLHGSYMKFDDVVEYGKIMFVEGIKLSCEYYCSDQNSCAGDMKCTNNCDIVKAALEKYNKSNDTHKP